MKRLVVMVIVVMLLLFCTNALAAELYQNELPENAERYAAYVNEKPNLAYEEVLRAVNLKLDEKNYTNIVTVPAPDSLTVFVSKHYALPKKYKPENLVSVDRKYAKSGQRLREDCNDAFLKMAKDMEAQGLTLYIQSGYRRNTKRGDANSLWYAWPGHSEHQTGLAFDLRKKNVTYRTLGEYQYERTKEYAWLMEHGWQYGFILSYPKGKSAVTGFGFEPWHWRYVGLDVAKDMKEKGHTTYHEYWADYMIQKVFRKDLTGKVHVVVGQTTIPNEQTTIPKEVD